MTASLGAGVGMLGAAPLPRHRPSAGAALLILATKWGNDEPWDVFCRQIAESGYGGFESWLPSEEGERASMFAAAKAQGLQIGLLVGGHETDAAEHLRTFEKNLRQAAAHRPLYINCHSGRDYFSFAQNQNFVEAGAAVTAETGIPVYHETHRSRMLYSAAVAREYMEQIPGLRITLDISHWCNVHESFLEGQEDTVEMALQRTDHIHARIGHPEGPQVGDPRAPEWKNALERHLGWWDRVVSRKKKEGEAPITILTEFGPPDYLPTLPYTRQPVADQREINEYMLHTLRERYAY